MSPESRRVRRQNQRLAAKAAPIPRRSFTLRTNGQLLLVCGVALLIRLLVGFQLLSLPLVRTPRLDSAEYLEWARRIASGDWSWPFVSAHAPGYPVFLGGVIALFGHTTAALVTVQSMIGALTASLVTTLGRRLFDQKVAIVGGMLYALYGPVVYIETSILAEGLLLCVLTLGLVLLASSTVTTPRAIGIGLLFGVAVLIRPTAAFTLVILIPWILMRDGGSGLRCAAAMTVAAALVTAPVLMKNASIAHSVAVQGFGGMNFYIGNSPLHDGMPTYRLGAGWDRLMSEAKRAGVADPADWDRYYFEKTAREIKAQPIAFLRLLLGKTLWAVQSEEVRDTHSYYFFTSQSAILRVLPRMVILFPLACAGLLLSLRDHRSRSLLLAVYALAAVLNISLLVVGLRYRIPIAPALAVYAGAGVIGIVAAAQARRFRELAALLGVAVAAVLISTVRTDAATHNFSEEWGLSCGSLITEHNLAAAETACDRALKIDPENGLAWDMRGLVLYNQQHLTDARSAFSRAVSLDPMNARAHFHLGLVAEQEQRLSDAAADYETALTLDQFNLDILRRCGRILARLGKTTEAAPLLHTLTEQAPSDPDAHADYAGVLAALGDLRAAKAQMIRVVELAPRSGDGWLDLSLLSMDLGDLDGPFGARLALENAGALGASPEKLAFASAALMKINSQRK